MRKILQIMLIALLSVCTACFAACTEVELTSGTGEDSGTGSESAHIPDESKEGEIQEGESQGNESQEDESREDESREGETQEDENGGEWGEWIPLPPA